MLYIYFVKQNMLKYGKDCLAQKLDFHLKQAYLQPLNTQSCFRSFS